MCIRDSNWAVLLKDPRKAYLELALHPAKSIPYVASEDTANIYNTPKSKSEIARPGAKGITAKPNSEKINVIIGPKKNKTKLACVGDTYSFNKSLSASANAWSSP